MKMFRGCIGISMLVAFLCMNGVLTDEDMNKGDSNSGYKLPEETIGGHFFCKTKILQDTPKKWEHNVVPYIIEPSVYSEENMKSLKEAIASWNEQVPDIQFVERQGNETDFVVFEYTDFCASGLGREGGPQPLFLGEGCLHKDIIHHEMMHTIGFKHEHNRHDRDEYVEVLFENIPEEWKEQFEKIDCSSSKILDSYDYYSVTHYLNFAPDNEDFPAFKVLKDGVDEKKMKEERDLTKKDKMKIKRLYGKSKSN